MYVCMSVCMYVCLYVCWCQVISKTRKGVYDVYICTDADYLGECHRLYKKLRFRLVDEIWACKWGYLGKKMRKKSLIFDVNYHAQIIACFDVDGFRCFRESRKLSNIPSCREFNGAYLSKKNHLNPLNRWRDQIFYAHHGCRSEKKSTKKIDVKYGPAKVPSLSSFHIVY